MTKKYYHRKNKNNNNKIELIDKLFPTQKLPKQFLQENELIILNKQHNSNFKKRLRLLLIMNKLSQTTGHYENPMKFYYEVCFGERLGLGLDINDFKII
jgi:hypothetical protein